MLHLLNFSDSGQMLDYLAGQMQDYSTRTQDPFSSPYIVPGNSAMRHWLIAGITARNGVLFPGGFSFLEKLILGALPGVPDSDVLGMQIYTILCASGNREHIRALLPPVDPENLPATYMRDLATRLAGIIKEILLQAWPLACEVIQRDNPDGIRAGIRFLMSEVFPPQSPWGSALRSGEIPDSSQESLPVYLIGAAQLADFYARSLTQAARYRDVYILNIAPAGFQSGIWFSELRNKLSHWKAIAAESEVEVRESHQESAGILPVPGTALRDLKEHLIHGSGEVRAPDTTLQSFAAPDIFREVQVIHAHILRRLLQQPDLTPGDFLVIVPDTNLYAPLFEAVSSGSESEKLKFSYTNLKPERGFQKTFLHFLTILIREKGEFTREDFFQLVTDEITLLCLDCSATEAREFLGYLFKAGFYRDVYESESYENHNLASALRRMRLAKVNPAADHLWAGTSFIPADYLQVSENTLFRFSEFADNLHRIRAALLRPGNKGNLRSLAEKTEMLWQPAAEDPDVREILALFRRLLQACEDIPVSENFSGTDFLFFFRQAVNKRQIRDIPGGRSVAVSTLLPIRPIPYRFVYIAGMQSGNYDIQEESLADPLEILQSKELRDAYAIASREEKTRLMLSEAICNTSDGLVLSFISPHLSGIASDFSRRGISLANLSPQAGGSPVSHGKELGMILSSAGQAWKSLMSAESGWRAPLVLIPLREDSVAYHNPEIRQDCDLIAINLKEGIFPVTEFGRHLRNSADSESAELPQVDTVLPDIPVSALATFLEDPRKEAKQRLDLKPGADDGLSVRQPDFKWEAKKYLKKLSEKLEKADFRILTEEPESAEVRYAAGKLPSVSRKFYHNVPEDMRTIRDQVSEVWDNMRNRGNQALLEIVPGSPHYISHPAYPQLALPSIGGVRITGRIPVVMRGQTNENQIPFLPVFYAEFKMDKKGNHSLQTNEMLIGIWTSLISLVFPEPDLLDALLYFTTEEEADARMTQIEIRKDAGPSLEHLVQEYVSGPSLITGDYLEKGNSIALFKPNDRPDAGKWTEENTWSDRLASHFLIAHPAALKRAARLREIRRQFYPGVKTWSVL